MSIEESILALSEIYATYSDSNLHHKILEFIKRELPERLDTHIERMKRQDKLEKGTEVFINEFLINSGMKYMYIAKSDIFVKYDTTQFTLVNESEILHEVLTRVSNNKELIPWKYKIKNMIMKKIKDTSLFTTIPESHTIQKVLSHITPLLLPTREEAKYFLSVIGDNILKKLPDNIHLVDVKAKDFITALSDNIFSYFKNKYHIDTTIKYAWYDHPYTSCRVINFNKAVSTANCWNTFIKYHILDIMAVSVYYSNRFENSDCYALENMNNECMQDILYLKDYNETSLINVFITENLLMVKDEAVTITVKEMRYLWKKFLADKKLPSVIFMSQVTTILSQILTLQDGLYIGVTSKDLSYSDPLRRFWRDNMIEEDGEEIEVSELYCIFIDWLMLNPKDQMIHISEKTFISVLEHYHEINLYDDKYVKNYKCLLWDKKEEIRIIIGDLKIAYKFSPDCFEKSIDILYNDYCSRCKTKFNYRVTNKQEFEKYINQIIPDKYIIRKRILNDYWNI